VLLLVVAYRELTQRAALDLSHLLRRRVVLDMDMQRAVVWASFVLTAARPVQRLHLIETRETPQAGECLRPTEPASFLRWAHVLGDDLLEHPDHMLPSQAGLVLLALELSRGNELIA